VKQLQADDLPNINNPGPTLIFIEAGIDEAWEFFSSPTHLRLITLTGNVIVCPRAVQRPGKQ
jgi:hypothetical protein